MSPAAEIEFLPVVMQGAAGTLPDDRVQAVGRRGRSRGRMRRGLIVIELNSRSRSSPEPMRVGTCSHLLRLPATCTRPRLHPPRRDETQSGLTPPTVIGRRSGSVPTPTSSQGSVPNTRLSTGSPGRITREQRAGQTGVSATRSHQKGHDHASPPTTLSSGVQRPLPK